MTFSYSVRIELIIVPGGLISVSNSVLAPFTKQLFKINNNAKEYWAKIAEGLWMST